MQYRPPQFGGLIYFESHPLCRKRAVAPRKSIFHFIRRNNRKALDRS